jgi:catechol 2,3-dioxygenase-like lactoylglutathione lyase family enzyme
MIEGLEHLGLSVSNLDKSIELYCKNLYCEVIRIVEANTNSLLGKVVDMPDCVARIAHLKAGPNMLELFEYTKPKGGKYLRIINKLIMDLFMQVFDRQMSEMII